MPITVILVLLFALSLRGIQVNLEVSGFPEMAQYYKVSMPYLELTVAYNTLGISIGSLLYGPLSDSLGRRKLLLIGSNLMALAAIGCCIPISLHYLNWFRFLQGLGASASSVLVFSIIADMYLKEKSLKFMGVTTGIAQICISLGPVIGAFSYSLLGWEGNFLLVAFLSIISSILLHVTLPETLPKISKLKFANIMGGYKILLLDTKFVLGVIGIGLTGGILMIFVASSSLIYRKIYNFSIIEYAYILGLVSIIIGFFSYYSVKIASFLGINRAYILSNIIGLISMVILVFTSIESNPSAAKITIILSVFFITSAIYFPIQYTKLMHLHPHLKGTISSGISGFKCFCYYFLVTISSYLFDAKILYLAIIMLITVVCATMCNIVIYKRLHGAA